jgi:hypothetical protein
MLCSFCRPSLSVESLASSDMSLIYGYCFLVINDA